MLACFWFLFLNTHYTNFLRKNWHFAPECIHSISFNTYSIICQTQRANFSYIMLWFMTKITAHKWQKYMTHKLQRLKWDKPFSQLSEHGMIWAFIFHMHCSEPLWLPICSVLMKFYLQDVMDSNLGCSSDDILVSCPLFVKQISKERTDAKT